MCHDGNFLLGQKQAKSILLERVVVVAKQEFPIEHIYDRVLLYLFFPQGFFGEAKNLALRNILWNTSYAAKVIICPLLLMCCSCTMFDLNNFTVLFFNLFSTRTQKTELQTLIPISPKCLNLKNVQPAKTQVQNCNNWSSNSLYFRIYQNHPNSSNSTVFRTLNPRSGFKALHIARKKLPKLYAFIIILRAKIRW